MPSSYDLLHPEVQRWIRDEGWTELRQVQDRAIAAILGGGDDVLISAATAAGKTEAAFLPLITQAVNREASGLAILYVSPLKALINDQARRLDGLCETLGLPLVRWHGDAPQGPKTRTFKDPRGVALITPESIEAMLVRRPGDARRLLGSLDGIVIDELHAFLRGPRGLHLASLLRRIDAMAERRPRRIGLSATIGDPSIAAAWLNPQAASTVVRIDVAGGQPELRLQVRGYVQRDAVIGIDAIGPDGIRIEGDVDALSGIADHGFMHLRAGNNLLFAGSRRNVEELADRLRARSDAAGVPNAFLPHHGNLSRELREEVEGRLKAGDVPTTAIATTTLELGIDIGSVASIAQLGPPRSIAGLRQRLGRSGRRAGAAAVMRIYLREPAAPDGPLSRLHLPTVGAVAAVRLLLDRFVEPPDRFDASSLSVAVQQTLSLIVERGGVTPAGLHRALFFNGALGMSTGELAILLRGMADPDAGLIEQSPDGLLMLGREGERITVSRDFYANFDTDEEWRLVAGGRNLGTIPLSNAVAIGGLVGFAGRRWRIVSVDDAAKVVDVVSHPSGRLPQFDSGSGEPIHDRMAAEMLAVLRDEDLPPWADAVSNKLLQEARDTWSGMSRTDPSIIEVGRTTLLFTWRGSAFNELATVVFVSAGHHAEANDVGVEIEGISRLELVALIPHLLTLLDAGGLSKSVEGLRRAKYDAFVPEALLRLNWARRHEGLVADVAAFLAGLARDPGLAAHSPR
ncbi:DEAD/DEAH box helicase [Sphingomonas albertensis]|uniref:DEAD/DEAH box helicase n=1 Tax=Sphingomonas albertensis TaxID=2762591 RepID=A0ABR7AL27_9SPHN|nr:DEAD/DEAH box helicase [Sphingomonas albertensis]MBC3941169.1 DEAD/DEAH box helicase [Sphingomonas albertensis]